MADLTTLLSKFLTDLYSGTIGTSFPVVVVRVGDGSASAPSYSFASATNKGLYSGGTNALGFSVAAHAAMGLDDANGLRLGAGYILGWSSTSTDAFASLDTIIAREGAGHFFQRNSTNAQRASWANTYSSTVSYEAFSIDWQTTANVATVGTRTAATGTGRQLKLVAQASSAGAFGSLTLDTNGTVTPSGTLVTAAGTTAIAPITLTNGTNLTAATANAIENDGAAMYATQDTTNGRAYWVRCNKFRLTGSGSGITTIADFFGSNDGIPLVANGVYRIHWHCKFSQATAGTATWTIVTATTALANLDAYYIGSNIAGIGTVGAPQYAGVTATSSSSTALPVTGTEATAATHEFDVWAIVVAGNGSSNTRLRLTMSAGTATPLTNSYFTVERWAAGNVGAFVA